MQMRSQTQKVTQRIVQMAVGADTTTQSTKRTLQAANSGRSAVGQTLAGMGQIRQSIQGMSVSTVELLARSEQIGSVAKTLEEFASQTNLLALNATFEAAGAGAAGRRFAIVAEEIRRLAQNSAQETQQVATLVQQVQSDIQAVTQQVQTSIEQVELGYVVAKEADGYLEDIEQLAQQSSGLVQQIAQIAQNQATSISEVDAAIQKIAQTAQQNEAESLQGQTAIQKLQSLSHNLKLSLARFRL
jgi:methyl-accepting chemotaxis protein